MPSDRLTPAPSAIPKSSQADYALVSTDHERQRLMRQGAILRGFLETAFRAAGIGPGMRVLDIGSGVGDVSFLAADLAGAQGSVVGVDRDPENVAWAAKRAAEAGRSNVRFFANEFTDFINTELFDALVGRFILMYLPDPVATLKLLSRHLSGGAVITFCEPDYTVLSTVVPEVPLLRQCEEWQREAFRASGARVDMGMRLYHTFRDSGFVDIGMTVSQLIGYGARREMIEFFVESIRSILPKIQQLRIATPEEVNVDTLADRIEAQARAVDPQWVSIRYISAWARKP
jgi:ubiquinone/menaquinone biosynthesis C-methylase UbiE